MSEFIAVISCDRHHAAIGGDIDLDSVEQLDAALADLSGDVDVDCTAVTFIGSSGFHSLDRRNRAALAHGARFVVSGMSPFQRRVAAILSVPYVI